MEKRIMALSRVLSKIFNPFYMPFVCVVALLLFSYLRYFPWQYQLFLLVVVYLFTILFPILLLRLYRNVVLKQRSYRAKSEEIVVPYLISLISYTICCFLLSAVQTPYFIRLLIILALLLQIVCATVSIWFRLSVHAAAMGSLTTFFVIASVYFSFYSPLWLITLVLLSGVVCSAQLFLRANTERQLVIGYLLGVCLTAFAVFVL